MTTDTKPELDNMIRLAYPQDADQTVIAIRKLLGHIDRIAEDAALKYGVVVRFGVMGGGRDDDDDAEVVRSNRVTFTAWKKL